MQIPLQVAFDGVDKSPALEALVAREAAKLERFGRVTSCRVAIALPARKRRSAPLYQVRVDLTLPRGEIVVARHHSDDERNADVRFAVRDAFRAARRMLQDRVRTRRGQVKQHGPPVRGRVSTAVIPAAPGGKPLGTGPRRRRIRSRASFARP